MSRIIAGLLKLLLRNYNYRYYCYFKSMISLLLLPLITHSPITITSKLWEIYDYYGTHIPSCNYYYRTISLDFLVLAGSCTVKSVLRDHCHERPTVLTDHKFVAERPTFQYNWTCHQRPPVLTDHIFLANGVVFQDRFYCTIISIIMHSVRHQHWYRQVSATVWSPGPGLEYLMQTSTGTWSAMVLHRIYIWMA